MINGGNVAVAILPFIIMFFLYLIVVAVGFVILYFIIRAALNHSKLNQNMELLRIEISRMNEQLTLCRSSNKSKDPQEENC